MQTSFPRVAWIASAALLASGCAVTGEQARKPGFIGVHDGPVFDARVTFAGGEYDHDIEHSLDDKTSAGFVGILAEASNHSGYGGGISLEGMSSDDDLFRGQGVDDQQASAFEIAPFFLYRVHGGERFRMPLRVGPWIHILTLDDQENSDSLTWVTLGLRVAVEPEFTLARNKDLEFSLFSELSLAGGGTSVHLESSANDEDFDTSGSAFGFEFGPRLRWSHFFGSVSYLHRSISMDESDPENNVVVLGFDGEFDALALSFGGGF